MPNQPQHASSDVRRQALARLHSQQPAAARPQSSSAPAMSPTAPAARQRRSRRPAWWVLGLAAVLVIGIGWLAYGYLSTRAELAKLSNPKQSAQTQASELVAQIGKNVALPNEQPSMFTVQDASKLAGQDFFAGVQNGDRVLIFPKAGRALLYRPSTHKVLAYAKVGFDASQSQ